MSIVILMTLEFAPLVQEHSWKSASSAWAGWAPTWRGAWRAAACAWSATTSAEAARKALAGEKNVDCAENLAALCARLAGERVIVLSLPAGAAVEDTIRDLLPLCSSGDTIVDCGNSYYRDSMRRALALSQQGLRYIDAGVSGGIHGLEARLLPDARRHAEVDRDLRALRRLLAPGAERGWLHCGPSGAGHFAKMIHNGIEYGMMQSLAEGFALLAARKELDIDVGAPRRDLAPRQRGALVAARSVRRDPEEDEDLDGVAPVVADSGEGRWTALESIELGVPGAGDHRGADEPLLQPGRLRLRARACSP